MKLAVILTGLLLIIGAANSVPVTAGEVATGADEMPMGAEEIPEEFQEDTHNNTGMLALILSRIPVTIFSPLHTQE